MPTPPIQRLHLIAVTVLVLTALHSLAARAEPEPPTSVAAAQTLQGVIVKFVPPPAEAASPVYALRLGDGRLLPIVKAPQFPVPGEKGLKVEVKGSFVQVDGKPAISLDEVRVVTGETPLDRGHFPVRARCVHCGCRMQIDSAADVKKPCTACKCGKSNEECVHY